MKLWKCGWWLACGCTIASAAAAAEGKKYALVMGVENYDHPKLREPAPLKYSVDDVAELADRLRKHKFVVAVLTDETGRTDPTTAPTKANFERLLGQLMERCKPDDAVLLAFAGHGLQFSGQKDAYFCPKDARPFADQAKTLISLSQVYASLDKSFAGTKMILVDACRNDPDPGRGRGLDADSAPPPPKGVAALFSCSAGQRAFEHDSLKHGVFFHHVLKGLSGDAASRKGEITFSGLAEYVSQAVPETVGELFQDRSDIQQLPNLKADFVGRSPLLARIEIDLNPGAPPGTGIERSTSGGSQPGGPPGQAKTSTKSDAGRSTPAPRPVSAKAKVRAAGKLLVGTWEQSLMFAFPGAEIEVVTFTANGTYSFKGRPAEGGRYAMKGEKTVVLTSTRLNPLLGTPQIREWDFELSGDELVVQQNGSKRIYKRQEK